MRPDTAASLQLHELSKLGSNNNQTQQADHVPVRPEAADDPPALVEELAA